MKQKSEDNVEFKNKQYTVKLIPKEVQKNSYCVDRTVLLPKIKLDIQRLTLPVGAHETKKDILLVAPCFLSTLHYAAALKQQYPSNPLNLLVMDLNPFVLDCWNILNKLLSLCSKPDYVKENKELAAIFMTSMGKQVKKKFSESGLDYDSLASRKRDPEHLFKNEATMAQELTFITQLLDTYGVQMLSDIVSNAVLFCGNLGENERPLSTLIKKNPETFSIFYASNSFEMMSAQIFSFMPCANDKSPTAKIHRAYLTQMEDQLQACVYDLSIHLYTRRSDALWLKDVTYTVAQACPNKILVSWGNNNESVKRILGKQLDTLFLQEHHPKYPNKDAITQRPKELPDVCLLRDNKISELDIAANISQNRHTHFAVQTASSGAASVPPTAEKIHTTCDPF